MPGQIVDSLPLDTMKQGRVLHCLSQRPLLTGSGITLDALVREAAAAGREQRIVVGIPEGGERPSVGGLPPERVHPLRFGGDALPFPVPGMSDVMPYRSTVFSRMTAAEVDAYRAAWRSHLRSVISDWRPDVVHAHHAWLMSGEIRGVAPDVPIVVHGHGTALRQMELCPSLAPAVRRRMADVDRFAVLHAGHARAYAEALGLPAERFAVVGAGYREDEFCADGSITDGAVADRGPTLVYAGKYSRAKGLPWLLDALGSLPEDVVLHVAGSGAGAEAEALAARMDRMAPRVVRHGRLDQAALADLFRRCRVFVLPSFYEGLPLVLVEALACGCRLVATDLPGVRMEIAGPLGDGLTLVPCPRLTGVDVPREEDLPRFVDGLADAIRTALAAPPPEIGNSLAPFRWSAVFARIGKLWREVIDDRHARG